MAEVLLFHHALGVTPGVRSLAEDLEVAGHRVTVPDLYDGATFDSIADGVAHAEQVGFEAIIGRGVDEADGLGDRLVVIGFSLGVLPAQKLAQTRPGVSGAILCHAAVPPSMFGAAWPDGVGLQLHLSEDDELAEEDLEVARDLAAEVGGELFIYPGSGHLIADPSFTDYNPEQSAMMLKRMVAFIDAR